jgi:hypothetical protein
MRKSKSDDLSSSDCPSGIASHAPGHIFADGLEAKGTITELAARGRDGICYGRGRRRQPARAK